MSTQTKRPIFLDLQKIRMPVMAVVSIIHRISGVLMVLLLPVLAYLFELSLRNAQGFDVVMGIFRSTPVKIVGVLLLWLLAHHFFAGIRFLLLDADVAIAKNAARQTAWMVHAAAIITLFLLVGGML